VLGDLVAAARNRVNGGRAPAESAYANLPVLPPSAAVSKFQVRLDVVDRTGVLAKVAAAHAAADVSIESVRQMPGTRGLAHLVITTHEATEAARQATIAALEQLDVVDRVVSVLRVEGED
jgi:homoserine dehydrogenase